jgi:hypothetical protein
LVHVSPELVLSMAFYEDDIWTFLLRCVNILKPEVSIDVGVLARGCK